MIDISIAQIAQIVGGQLSDISDEDAAACYVSGTVEFDSRAVGSGGLFLALPGAQVDGHDFAAAAIEQGAVAVLAARPVGVPAIVVPPAPPADALSGVFEHDHDGAAAAVLAAVAKLATAVAAELVAQGLTIVGITGSSGKTSTKDLIAAVLRPLGQVVAPPGSFNNELGLPWTVLQASRNTDFLVVEMSARHPGNIAALATIAQPAIGVVLNVGTAHLGEFGSREAIAATKAELVQAVQPSGVVVLNSDDSAVSAMAELTSARIVRVSSGQYSGDVDVYAREVNLDQLARPRFQLHSVQGHADVQLSVHGEHQVSNALCAAAVALECGASIEQVATVLSRTGPVSAQRMQVSTRDDGVTIINDAYNANPDSMRAGLQALAAMGRDQAGAHRRTWAVLGEMAELGKDSVAEHDRIGRLAVRLGIRRLIAVGTSRSVNALYQGAVIEGSWRPEAMIVSDVSAAVALLSEQVQPGDVILVKASNSVGLGVVAQALTDLAEKTGLVEKTDLVKMTDTDVVQTLDGVKISCQPDGDRDGHR